MGVTAVVGWKSRLPCPMALGKSPSTTSSGNAAPRSTEPMICPPSPVYGCAVVVGDLLLVGLRRDDRVAVDVAELLLHAGVVRGRLGGGRVVAAAQQQQEGEQATEGAGSWYGGPPYGGSWWVASTGA